MMKRDFFGVMKNILMIKNKMKKLLLILLCVPLIGARNRMYLKRL